MRLELLGGFFALLAAILSALRFYFLRKIKNPSGAIYAVISAYIVSCLIFLPISIILHFPDFRFSKIGVVAFLLSGILVFFGVYCMYEGIQRIGASRTAPITRGNMLISSSLAILFLGETTNIMHIIGILLIFIGVVQVSQETGIEDSDSRSMSVPNLTFPLVSMLCLGLSSPLVKFGFNEGVPVTVGLSISRLASLIIGVLFLQYNGLRIWRPFYDGERVLYIAAALIFALITAFVYISLDIAPVIVVRPLRGTSPFFVLLLSHLYLKDLEKITKKLVLGAILIVLGGILIGLFM